MPTPVGLVAPPTPPHELEGAAAIATSNDSPTDRAPHAPARALRGPTIHFPFRLSQPPSALPPDRLAASPRCFEPRHRWGHSGSLANRHRAKAERRAEARRPAAALTDR